MQQEAPVQASESRLARAYRASAAYFERVRLRLLLGFLVLGIIILALFPMMVITIHPGEAGVLFRRFTGTDMDHVYDEGLYVIWPWNKMYVYNIRVQSVERVTEVLTKDGLPIKLTVAIRFHPDYRMLPMLHRTVGPDYANRIVLPETIAVLRRYVGAYEPIEVYTTKRGLLDTIIVNALEQSGERFVRIDDVLIKYVELPEPVRKAIEDKLIYEQRQLAYRFRIALEEREAERKRIEAAGIRDYNRIVSETLSEDLIRWQGVQATKELATSDNAKTVIIGGGPGGLPVILGNVDAPPPPRIAEPAATPEPPTPPQPAQAGP